MSAERTCARDLNGALRTLLAEDERVVVLGEDIADPYGGAFKITKGLSSSFPGRVRTTPVSEGAIVGIACGLALGGFRPIVEIMFGDFLGLCFDQLVNHAAKYEAMYAGAATCPVIVRTPMGGGRAYGPTHSQSLEKYFFGVPHLKVVAYSPFVPASALLGRLLSQNDPALFVEHKLLYPLPRVADQGNPEGEGFRSLTLSSVPGPEGFPVVSCRAVEQNDCAATVVAYGYHAYRVAELVDRLAFEEELFVELLIPHLIAPLDLQVISDSVAVTGRLITVEEGTAGWSWGSELSSRVCRSHFGSLRSAPRVLTSEAEIIPAAKEGEQRMLVNLQAVESAIREMCR